MANKSSTDTDELLSKLDDLFTKAKANIKSISSKEELELERIRYTGRKSELTSILRGIKDLSPEGKQAVGSRANEIRIQVDQLIDQKRDQLIQENIEKLSNAEKIDVTVPSQLKNGHQHIISQMQAKIEDIFQRMGFQVVYPYEIDTDYNNFQAVNIPEGHPARDSWDTFWTEDDHIAVTHTSSMQNRVLKSSEPPIRVIVPGRTFRHEATDARHEHTFTQVEGVYVDKGITFADMLGTLKAFFSEFFEKDIQIKFSPDFFPFVEPGGMISIDVSDFGDTFKEVTKGTGWLEILGCGMIHPKVLEMGGIDPNVYSGFAWGFGLERLVMPKFGIEDVRHFYKGDLAFIRQF
ncbi:MAG: phenylalanine--tRNA ligase subunit alpha [Candidatus Dojkabacteria bacterium]|uniref:Phenylalanine--tRNA ligase alpha subunit n=2 Tax=Candidatus Dojkabacteria TaxID=74243 RepID=A0A136KF28_9BACT|nr:MAG: Phenylalanine--tRNA ligase alpha subunit [candidate division WS6 bacterium OLB21]MBW7953963.1 phenylalanine--tRNA ligase subunit alpha [Candidatus Dojkabacteria bacterium]WKZ28302.1 MAG: phenylalanine--tRNA ligase subunit alpha [Candidatus Dojkabacteria bacterium]